MRPKRTTQQLASTQLGREYFLVIFLCLTENSFYLYIARAHLRTPGRIPFPASGLSAADPVRSRPWCLASRLVRRGGGVGLQTTAVTRCAATRQATALYPSPRLAGQSTAGFGRN